MKNIRSHFVFNKSQRNGIFLLIIFIILLQGIYFYFRFSSETKEDLISDQELEQFRQEVDSLKNVAAAAEDVKIFPFNPNFITDYKGYTLGMSLEEINKLHAFREKDKYVNSAKQFQEVTGVSDSLLEEISPYFKFPSWVNQSQPKSEKSKISSAVSKIDLNKADAEQLKKVNGIGDVLSARIIKYRESIGGFRSEIQLFDVYGLSLEVIERIRQNFIVILPSGAEKTNLNTISVLELSELPYFNYEIAREVIEYRNLRGEILDFEEMAKIKGFPFEKLERIKLYLTLD